MLQIPLYLDKGSQLLCNYQIFIELPLSFSCVDIIFALINSTCGRCWKFIDTASSDLSVTLLCPHNLALYASSYVPCLLFLSIIILYYVSSTPTKKIETE